MKVITAYTPDGALVTGMKLLKECGSFELSRAGEVLVSDTPVTTRWPPNRSLASLNPIRDSNPFFHLNEAIWMLKGENDARKLDVFVSDFSKRFAEPDGTLHGAYGYRWRKHFAFDQLEWIISKLKEDPQSRQCVLQMWNCSNFVLDDDLKGDWKDRPCNTHIYFRIQGNLLDMTICCRSNDIIWGAYGANIVHFGVLHEYMAAKIGVKLGFMYQVSNNFHAYTDVLGPLLLKMEKAGEWERPHLQTMNMFNEPVYIDRDLDSWGLSDVNIYDVENNLFKITTHANQALKNFRAGAPQPFASVEWTDWHESIEKWLQRRADK